MSELDCLTLKWLWVRARRHNLKFMVLLFRFLWKRHHITVKHIKIFKGILHAKHVLTSFHVVAMYPVNFSVAAVSCYSRDAPADCCRSRQYLWIPPDFRSSSPLRSAKNTGWVYFWQAKRRMNRDGMENLVFLLAVQNSSQWTSH